ncbi:MAG: NUDIX domain-containing protein [Caldilineales bacterium]|nr:NUDIX domain-containing protein [Caldilineales bacterium]
MPAKLPIKRYDAAGGVVLDAVGRVLLLERLVPRNDELAYEIRLPKGHIEPGEGPAQTALREVCEESGYCHLTILADLGAGVTEFDWEGRHIIRSEHYYLMRLAAPDRAAPQPSRPDAEEALFRPLWATDLAAALALLTFESEKQFVRRALAAGAA